MFSFDLTELEDALEDNAEQTGVSFAKRSLKLDTEEDAIEVVKAIQECSHLKFLNLEGNTLGPLAAKAVAEALKKNGSQLKIAVWKDMFTGRSKEEIPKSLEYFGTALSAAGTSLTELDLSDNAFGPIGVKGLANLLTSNTCHSLCKLHLNNNGLGISGGKMLAKALLDCYEHGSSNGTQLALKVFEAGRNRLENEGAEALANVFKKLTTLEEVAMPQNGICHQGIIALAEGLSANPSLRILNLNDNTVGPKGAKAIAKALPNFHNLEHLNLGDCLLKTKGCMILSEALGLQGNHDFLMELNLSFNEIGIRGVAPITEAMANKKFLTKLLLDGNSFGTEGRVMLCKSLMQLNLINSLGTLNEDESNDDEDDDEDEDEDENEDIDEDEDEGEDEDEDEDDDINDDHTNESSNFIMSLQNKKADVNVTVPDFLKSPTGEKLLLLKYESAEPFVEYVKNSIKGNDVQSEFKFTEEFMKMIMNVSSFCGSGYVDIRIKAENLTDTLYAKLFELAVKHNQITILNNALLVNLGLLKSEDKRAGKVDWNLEGCFKALEKISQKEYFLQQTRDTLKFFLEKPVIANRAKIVDSFQDAKISLRCVLNNSHPT